MKLQYRLRGSFARGFTLVELMVALLLGLLVVAAAGSIFLSNRRVYGNTEGLNRIQESQRAAFEMLSRDLREAGANPCGNFGINNVPAMLWTGGSNVVAQTMAAGISGNGGSEVTVYLADPATLQRVVTHATPSAELQTSGAAGIAAGDVLVVCDGDVAATFKSTGIAGNSIAHAVGDNCGGAFTWEPDLSRCADASAGPGYCFRVPNTPTATDVSNCPGGIARTPAFVFRPATITWRLGANGRGGTSLYRETGGQASEIAEGVTSLEFTYRLNGNPNYVAASTLAGPAQWGQVIAVRVRMTFAATQGALASRDVQGVDGAVLERQIEDYIVLRNHQEGIL